MTIPVPDMTYEAAGVEVARWGQAPFQPHGTPLEPMPTVYSCKDDIELGEWRLSFAEAEALAVRVEQAIAYERHRGQERLASHSDYELDRLSDIADNNFRSYYAARWTDLLPAALDAVHELAIELNRRWTR